MSNVGWRIDLDSCTGCEACTVSCRMENNTPLGATWRWVIKREEGTYPNVAKTFVTSACNHCEDPACMASCPVSPKAISKRDDGIVWIDDTKCIGCRYCEKACPYGAPQWNEHTRKMEKCTFCKHRIDAGMGPACAATCVGRALHWEQDIAPDFTHAPDGFPDHRLTNPSVKFERGFGS